MTHSQAIVTREVEEHQVRLRVQAKGSQTESLVQIGRADLEPDSVHPF
jgi:hypothetical protein